MAELFEIDTVDVVNLQNLSADRVSEYMQHAEDAPCLRVSGQRAQRIAHLWRELPLGKQSRCHTPPIGLRFYSRGELQLRASICWECDNIFGDFKNAAFHYAFDAQHPLSQELLALCQHILNSVTVSDALSSNELENLHAESLSGNLELSE